ncbi:hypothetical protein P691DRAFT_686860, partial [Macrolepiota fuliginosa MF-IS2]
LFCMIYLSITLTCIWGNKPANSHKYKMLRNFLHLVTTVKIGSMRTTSSKCTEKYEYHMRTYLKSLLELYPGSEISPYQHMALHIGQQLHCFGPMHSWRCYTFEQFNHIFQTIETNNIYDELTFLQVCRHFWCEMEKTMFKRFCMMQNLCMSLNPTILPQELHKIVEEFDNTFGSRVLGTLFSDQLYGASNQ